MKEELIALYRKQPIGHFKWDRSTDVLEFQYSSKWQSNRQAFPLSLSMAISTSVHHQKVVEPFLWGLLPDNDGILRRWGERFHVSHRHPFQLLRHVGEECAGAVSLLPTDKLETWMARDSGNLQWLSTKQVTERIEHLLRDHSATRVATDHGQFSLAGAQPKTAFFFDLDSKRWAVPKGDMPTTHILKPATGDFDGHSENEHFCLRIATHLGLKVARTEVQYFGKNPVIVVERFDRNRKPDGSYIRIHQEDMCQALGRYPQDKYQNQGGPSAKEILDLLRQYANKDIWRFVDGLILNWLIAGTDAHAKNYSLLLAERGQVRLAPFYDISSSLPYPKTILPRKAKMAMTIGKEYVLSGITPHHWEKAAADFKLPPEELLTRIRSMGERMPVALEQAEREVRDQGLNHSVIRRLVAEITKRTKACLDCLA